MLKLVDIKKDYYVGDQTINALKGINLEFGDAGLVAILGQSGCGKTTLMNIIGGLDHYTSGDVIINGQSTKDYAEKDWNAYRNNSIGFVFQSYNLIPHMNVIANVELALTLSGIDAKERKERALEMLKKVGLETQANKRPNQLSGGQCQRVAIARALVNNPSIILADEPTGAIDSETSTQIMDLLKEISKDCLIIMVTHNGEIATQYADRIINMRDGLVQNEEEIKVDELPVEEIEISEDVVEDIIEDVPDEILEEIVEEKNVEATIEEEVNAPIIEAPSLDETKEKGKKKKRKTSMSFFTAFKLSLANLINKKGRSFLTILAGSIGIICISLILAMNSGFSSYIADYEANSLSKYPVQVFSPTNSLMDMIEDALSGDDIDVSKINLNTVIDVFKNDETAREKYTDEEKVFLEKVILGIIENSDNISFKISSDISKFMNEVNTSMDPSWATIRKDYNLRLNIYDEKEGEYTRINPLFDLMYETVGEVFSTGFTEEMQTQVKTMLDSLNIWGMMVDDKEVLSNQYDVIAGHFPNYETEEGKYEMVIVVDEYNQIDDDVLIFLDMIELGDLIAALIFGNDEAVKQEYEFSDFIGREYTLMMPTDYYTYNTTTHLYNYSNANEIIATRGRKIKISGIVRLKEGVSAGCISGALGYTQALAEEIINYTNNSQMVIDQKAIYNNYQAKRDAMTNLMLTLKDTYGVSIEDLSTMTEDEMTEFMSKLSFEDKMTITMGMTAKITSVVTGETLETAKYEQLLTDLSVKDLNAPQSIYIYPSSIDNKDKVINFINEYNAKIAADEELANSMTDYSVTYTDELSEITSSMQEMINTITYILIAVAVLAVVVAMLLVAIILYISVQDRTKEIGILRSLGASKGNVSNVFVAETFIIGLFSGVIGVVFGLILTFPANAIVVKVLGIENLLQPTWWQCLLLIAFSFVTTMISGIIPASLAAKKDPVLALRTE